MIDQLSGGQRFFLDALASSAARVFPPHEDWDAVAPSLEIMWTTSQYALGTPWASVEPLARRAWELARGRAGAPPP